MLSRNKEQEKILFVVYQYLFYQRMNRDDLVGVMEDVFEMPYDEISLFSKEVCVKTLRHQKEIDEVIAAHLRKWTLERINLVAHAILLFAIGEYRYTDACNKAEMIDIAVQLAKKYLDDNDYKYIHAILDKVL